MGYGQNFTRVAIGPNAHDKTTLFIDGTSNGTVQPHIDILWVDATEVEATGAEFHGIPLAPNAEQHVVGSFDVTNSQWRVAATPPPEGFPKAGTWISISGRMRTKKTAKKNVPAYIAWSNMLEVERAKKPS